MTRRSLAIVISVPLMVGLWIAAALVPVPYVTLQPGVTVDVLSEVGGQERIQVNGARAYYEDDQSQIRMTTVSVTRPRDKVSIFAALKAWVDDAESVEPYGAVYDDEQTPEQSDVESEVSMLTSQDTAIAVALRELDYELTPTVEVYQVTEDAPADGVFKVRDRILSVDGEQVTQPQQIVDAVKAVDAGTELEFVVLRGGERKRLTVAPEKQDGRTLIGIWPGSGFVFPVDVTINISPDIGGPSAGLMFSLAIYDTLTPGSLTGGRPVAGTGTIDIEGRVGGIGGIQQKVVGARDSGAQLFLVPAANCEDALAAPNGDMRLARVETMKQARKAIEDFAADPDASLPSCADGA
ncbi:YlbL family protein [Nocardioides donggukensis]|uniref:PDZ domain-containing protein n=1 Tax=Nocardioides donggukensis TaxID=2774019 RepID=A0A927Q1K7_9ACTN|nr:PDZ domain-containing protein [Nocardioides donggukensis]MBD8870212.1 PDZ domain-containing protein [Nocardioides donggukensis]